jgi:peptide/nickel transport system permease protein
MVAYLVRRLLYAVPILIGVSLVTFVLFYVVVPPRQLARRNLTSRHPSNEEIQDWLHAHGYDKPLRVQFGKHMKELLLFQFGKSDASEEPVWDKIHQGAGPSLMLAIPEFFASIALTIALALLVAYYRGTYLDYWGVALCVVLMSINYILFIFAGQYVFAKLLRIYPLAGFHRGWEGFRFILLPSVVGLISGLGGAVRYYRAAFLEEMGQDYVRTARSKGVPETRILFTHVLKNAASPILTAVVLSIPFLFLGNLIMETFFGIPGLGSITVDAINSGDFAVVRAMVFLGTVAYIIGNIMTDVSYALVNPRVRLE